MSTSHRQELVAEFLVLDLYDELRVSAGHDYGAGQRHAELRRRRQLLESRGIERRVLESLDSVSPAELVDAFQRVGRPRLERIEYREAYRAHTPATTRTADTWRRVHRLLVNRSTADARLAAVSA